MSRKNCLIPLVVEDEVLLYNHQVCYAKPHQEPSLYIHGCCRKECLLLQCSVSVLYGAVVTIARTPSHRIAYEIHANRCRTVYCPRSLWLRRHAEWELECQDSSTSEETTVLSRWKAQPEPHVSIAFSRTHLTVARPGDITRCRLLPPIMGGKPSNSGLVGRGVR